MSKRGDKRRRRERRRRASANERNHEERGERGADEEPALTAEEMRQGREQMREWVATRPERLEQIKTELAQLFQPYDAFDLLANFWFANAVINPETYQESSFEGLAAITEFAAYVLLQRDRRDAIASDSTEPPAGDIIEAATGLIREALFAATLIRHHELAGSQPAELGPVRSDFAGQRMFIRGTSYDWQETATIRSLFSESTINQAIAASLGFDTEDALALAERCTQLALERLTEKRTLALEYEADLLSRLDRYRQTGDASPEDKSILSSLAQLKPNAAQTTIKSMAVQWLFHDLGRLSAITPAELAHSAGMSDQKSEAFLEYFSTRFGALPVAEPGWEIEIVRNRPIVSDGDGNYLPFAAYHILYGLRPAFEEALKQEPKAWTRYERHRAQAVEDDALAAIRAIGPTRTDLASVKYELPDGPDTYELDGLFVFDTVALFVEVKAGSLHPSARRGAPARLRRQLQDTVAAAAEQARRAREAFLSGTARNVQDKHGQPIKLDLQAVSRAFDVVVTLEHLPGVDTALWQLVDAELLPGDTPLPWVVKLHDLQIITALIEYTAFFPHYLSRRSRLNAIRRVEAGDELDWFMHYLTAGLYFDHIFAADESPDRVSLTSLTDDLDAYLFYTQGLRTRPAPKPRLKMPRKFRRLIEFMHREAMDGYMEASIALLELDGPGRARVPANMERMRRASARDRESHNMSLAFAQRESGGITVMSAPEGRGHEVLEGLPAFCELKKYQSRAARWAAFGVVAGEREPVQAIVVRYGPWEPNPTADKLLEDLGWDEVPTE